MPLAPEKVHLSYDQLSTEAKRRLSLIQKGKSYSQKKLISHFEPRKNYTVHYRLLQLYLNLGLRLKKIHKILYFEQRP